MTTRIQVSDSGLEVIPPRDTLTQGSENTLTIEFQFSGQWLECTEINAVFTDYINSAITQVTGGACVIPVGVLQNPWRFVSLSLNGTSLSGVITSPFVRIGQVLPSAMGGEGGKFVTMAQLMEILQGYVKTEDLGIYVTREELEAAIATLATQDDIARLDELKADKTTVAALASTVAAQGVAIENKADAATVTSLETRVGTNETNITALQNDKAEKTAVQALADEVAGKASDADLQAAQAAIAANTAAIATKADGDALDALSAAVADKANAADVQALSDIVDGKADESALADYWSKQEIGLQTAGTGTLFLADDGTYKPAAGDPPDLSAYLTKTEAEGTYADKVSMLTLENAVDAQAARIGTNETNISALQTEIAGKASDADVQALSARVGANETNIATNTAGIAANVTALTALDGRVGTAETNITALQNDKADASALADYETTAHAEATYETKADASKIKSVTAAGFAVTPDAAGNVNIGGTDVSRVGTSGSWGSEITYTISQTLPAGASSDTKGSSLTISKRTENSGATPRIIMRVDGVQIATSADIPDVSHFATVDYVQNTYESTAHASATYAKKTDIITVTDGDGKSFLANDGTYKVPAVDGVVKKVVQLFPIELTGGGYTNKWRELTPDANGTLEIQTAHASYAFGTYDGYGINQFAICDCMVNQDENPYVMTVLTKHKSNMVDSYVTIVMEKLESGSMSTLSTLDVPSIYMLDNRITTATTDMATQTWVQNYIASLDGTNMQF